MNKDQLEGNVDQLGGQVKEGWGGATGDERLETEGNMDQARGAGKELLGDTREGVEKVGDNISDAWDKKGDQGSDYNR